MKDDLRDKLTTAKWENTGVKANEFDINYGFKEEKQVDLTKRTLDNFSDNMEEYVDIVCPIDKYGHIDGSVVDYKITKKSTINECDLSYNDPLFTVGKENHAIVGKPIYDQIIFWHKLTEAARIPTKRVEDAGFDLYSINTMDTVIKPHEKIMLATGLQCAGLHNAWLMVCDRGSTGSIGLHVHCGVIDSGYRGEIFVCLCNDNDIPVVLTNSVMKTEKHEDKILYPLRKGIAQAVVIPLPSIDSTQVSDYEWDKWFAHDSERGDGKLGASGK